MNTNSWLPSLFRRTPILYKIAVWARNIVYYNWYKLMGLAYIGRAIDAGPNQGLIFYARWRVQYSQDFWSGHYELITCKFMQSVIDENDICYDIGANLGYHALIMARKASLGRVFAFEPLREVGRILERNVIENSISNVEWVQKAVTSSSGTISLGRNIAIDQAAIRWAGDRDPMCETFNCESVSVDDFVASGKPAPSFMKIDVEGAEVEVLSGATKTLIYYKPLVLSETHGVDAAVGVYRILHECGYELFNVNKDFAPIVSETDMPISMYEGHVFARPKLTTG